MAKSHEINKLEFNLSGKSDFEIQQLIRDLLPDIIESYFNKHNPENKIIQIDKIHFDLGTIKASNFKDELIVRLSYLLDTELGKFFKQTDIEDKQEENIIISKTDALMTYLQSGYSKYDDQDLVQLFEHLMLTNISMLREILDEVKNSPLAMQRLYLQVKFEVLLQFWTKTYPNELLQVKEIQDLIYPDFERELASKNNLKGLAEILKKLIFNFMMNPSKGESAGIKFLEEVKSHIDDFIPYQHLFGTTAFQFFNELTEDFLKGRRSVSKSKSDRTIDEEIVSNYILKGKLPDGLNLNLFFKKIRELSRKEISSLFKQLVSDTVLKKAQVDRLLNVISPKQFEILLENVDQLGTGRIAERLKKIDYLRTIIKEVFGESMSSFELSEYSSFLTAEVSEENLGQILRDYLNRISISKELDKENLIDQLSKRFELSGSQHAQVLIETLQNVSDQIKVEEQDVKKDYSLMYAYFYFLKTGVWLLEEVDPQEVILKLIEESSEHLKIELLRHLEIQTVWLRLIYQNTLEVVLIIFKKVFEQDDHLKFLLKALSEINSAELREPISRKVFEAFFFTKIKSRLNPELSFEVLFDLAIKDLPTIISESSEQQDDIEKILFDYLLSTDSDKKLKEQELQSIYKSLFDRPYILFEFISDDRIAKKRWKAFWQKFDKPQLLSLLAPIAELRNQSLFDAFLGSFESKVLEKLLTKQKLAELLSLIVKFEEQKLEELIIELLDKYGKNNPDNLIDFPTSLIDNLDKLRKSKPSAFVIGKFPDTISKSASSVKDLDELFVRLKKLGIINTSSQWSALLMKYLPFVRNVQELKLSIISNLLSEFPFHEKKLITLKVLNIQEARGSDFISFVDFIQALIFHNSDKVQPFFKDFKSFENYLIEVIQNSRLSEQLFGNISKRDLIEFFQKLSTTSRASVYEILVNRLSNRKIERFVEILHEKNPEKKEDLEIAIVVFFLNQKKNEPWKFLRYLEEFFPSFDLDEQEYSDIQDEFSETLSPLYVEAFVHHLKFQKFIYLPLEKDGIERALYKILALALDELKQELSKVASRNTVLQNLFSLIPENNWLTIFGLLFQYNRVQTQFLLDEISARVDSSKDEIFIQLAEILLSLNRNISTRELIETYLQKVDQINVSPVSKLFNEATGILSEELLRKIDSQETGESYTVSDVFKTITKTGQIPFWLRPIRQSELISILKAYFNKSPIAAQKLFENHLSSINLVQNVISYFGLKAFQDLFYSIDPTSAKEINKISRLLVKSHTFLGDSDSVLEYFLIRYTAQFYSIDSQSLNRIIPVLLSNVPYDFGLSLSDYLTLLEKSENDFINLYTQEINRTEIQGDTDISFQIDLLVYLLLRNEMPWWAESRIDEPISIKRLIEDLFAELIDKAPKELVQRISSKENSESIYDKLISFISIRQFDKVLLIIAPEFGGFVVSLNLLLVRSKLNYNKSKWQSFLLKETFATREFNALEFISRVLRYIAQTVNLKIEKLSSRLLNIAKEAIQNGEMRFLPFVELLDPRKQSIKALEQFSDGSKSLDSDFIKSFIYYLKSGFAEENSISGFNTYSQIEAEIQRLSVTRNTELRQAIIKELSEEWFAIRIIKNESERLKTLIIKILFQDYSEHLLSEKDKLILFLKKQWKDTSELSFLEIFYMSVFSQIKVNISKTDISELLMEFVRKAQNVLNQKVQFFDEEIKKLALDKELLKALGEEVSKNNIDKAESEKASVKNEIIQIQFLIDAFVFYLRSGFMSAKAQEKITSYSKLESLIEKSLEEDYEKISLAVQKEIGQEWLVKRLIEIEDESLLQFIIKLIYPTQSENLEKIRKNLFHYLIQKWPKLEEEDLIAFYFQSLFYQSADKGQKKLDHLELIAEFIVFTSDKIKEDIDFSKEEIHQLGLGPNFMKVIKRKVIRVKQSGQESEILDQATEISKVEIIPAQNLVESFIYFLQTGSISDSEIKSYLQLETQIVRQLQFEHNELRLAVLAEIAKDKTLARLIKRENERLLRLIVRIIYPSQYQKIFKLKIIVFLFLNNQWPEIKKTVLSDIFYTSMFKQSKDFHESSADTTVLLLAFVRTAAQLLNKEIAFSKEEMRKFGLDQKFMNALSKGFKEVIDEEPETIKKPAISIPPIEEFEEEIIDHRILIKNAGMVLIWPFLTRYFSMLDMTNDDQFKSQTEAERAVHLLQYMATGTTVAPEHELLLNKVLCGLKIATPVPLEVKLTEKEIETTDSLLKGVIQNWPRLKDSSVEALQQTFLTRDGFILEKEKIWELKVEKKTLDILMENLPWSFGTINLPWMEKRLNVEWL